MSKTYETPDTLYAWCHMFDVRFRCVRERVKGPQAARLRIDTWIHQLWTVNPDTGALIRQETVQGLNENAWKAAIGRLVSVRPQNLW